MPVFQYLNRMRIACPSMFPFCAQLFYPLYCELRWVTFYFYCKSGIISYLISDESNVIRYTWNQKLFVIVIQITSVPWPGKKPFLKIWLLLRVPKPACFSQWTVLGYFHIYHLMCIENYLSLVWMGWSKRNQTYQNTYRLDRFISCKHIGSVQWRPIIFISNWIVLCVEDFNSTVNC